MSEYRPRVKNAVYIGIGATINGRLTTEGRVVVEGRMEGKLICSHLVVGETGAVRGSAEVFDAEISGLVGPSMRVKRALRVYAPGRVEGACSYAQLAVEKGGVLGAEMAAIVGGGDPAPVKPKKSWTPRVISNVSQPAGGEADALQAS